MQRHANNRNHLPHLLWVVPLVALVGWSLLQQVRRPETLGEKIVRALQHADPTLHLRGAVPIIEFTPRPDDPAAVPLTQRQWFAGATEEWNGPGISFRLARTLQPVASPLREKLSAPALTQHVEAALQRAGLTFDRPAQLIAAAQKKLLALNDAQLLDTILQADVATLETSEDPDTVTQQALLLLAWDPRGAAVANVANQRLYVIETTPLDGARQAAIFNLTPTGLTQWSGQLTLNSSPQQPAAMPTLCRWLSEQQTSPANNAAASK